MRSPRDKIMTYAQARAWRDELHRDGRQLVVTNGCFDLLHRGHVEYLIEARQHGDALLVAINSDASLRQLKGPTRPLVSQDDRAFLLASLEAVDAVVIFPNLKPIDLFQAVPPDIYVKGGDYNEATTDRDEYPVLKAAGARFVFVPFVKGYSTSQLIAKIRFDASQPQRPAPDAAP
jgi:D-glycero-beta-D-manno-heptose 1-phosphate adenylyltransferase